MSDKMSVKIQFESKEQASLFLESVFCHATTREDSISHTLKNMAAASYIKKTEMEEIEDLYQEYKVKIETRLKTGLPWDSWFESNLIDRQYLIIQKLKKELQDRE